MPMLVAEIFGPDLLVVVVLAVALLVGAERLPKLARSLGEASRELRRSHDEGAAAATGEPGGDSGTTVTMSRSELDALIAEREARAREGREP
jgi:Sec-independent protein translocase protein TatA